MVSGINLAVWPPNINSFKFPSFDYMLLFPSDLIFEFSLCSFHNVKIFYISDDTPKL